MNRDKKEKVCHPERRAQPGVEGSSHHFAYSSPESAKILRLALLAQDDTGEPVKKDRPVGRSQRGEKLLPPPFMGEVARWIRAKPGAAGSEGVPTFL